MRILNPNFNSKLRKQINKISAKFMSQAQNEDRKSIIPEFQKEK